MFDLFLRMKVNRLIYLLEEEFGGRIEDYGCTGMKWWVKSLGKGHYSSPPKDKIRLMEDRISSLCKQLLTQSKYRSGLVWCEHIVYGHEFNKAGWTHKMDGWACPMHDDSKYCPICGAKRPEGGNG